MNSYNRCTSTVNPPSRLRGNDKVRLEKISPYQIGSVVTFLTSFKAKLELT